jgi:hypothetical protein
MKRILILTALAISVGLTASAQKLKEAEVPNSVKVTFAKLHPGITPKWEKEGASYEANFKKDGKAMSVVIQPNGTMTESEVSIKTEELPGSVLTYLKANYKDKKIKEAAKITKADGTINYEAEVEGKDVIFDKDGKFIKEAKD